MKRHAQIKKGIKNQLTGGANLHYTATGKQKSLGRPIAMTETAGMCWK